MAKKKKATDNHDHSQHNVTTLDLIKRYLSLKIEKMSAKKEPVNDINRSLIDQMSNLEINHIAIVLDGVVEDVIRCQNKMAALLLSEPTFVEFNPEVTKISLGTKYENNSFINNEEPNV